MGSSCWQSGSTLTRLFHHTMLVAQHSVGTRLCRSRSRLSWISAGRQHTEQQQQQQQHSIKAVISYHQCKLAPQLQACNNGVLPCNTWSSACLVTAANPQLQGEAWRYAGVGCASSSG